MSWILFIFLISFMFYVRRFMPVKGLKMLSVYELNPYIQIQQAQIVDIRDASEFYKGHLPGAINISIGRIPYVSQKHLNKQNPIILVSPSSTEINRAARMLFKIGYRNIAGFTCAGHQKCKEYLTI